MSTINIYTKLHKIQNEIGSLTRTEENKFQKYKFFNELQVLQLLRPLLAKYQLTVLFSDVEDKEFSCEQVGNMYLVKYQKKCLLVNSEKPEEQLIYYFWALGQNNDPAKAKGSAETYAIKYFLTKFFLIQVKDEMDPDYQPREEKVEMTPDERKTIKEEEKKVVESSSFSRNADQSLTKLAKQTNPSATINMQQVEDLINLLRQKNKESKEIQAKFFKELDDKLTKRGEEGTTQMGNFKMRFSLLSVEDYQYLFNWLLKLDDKQKKGIFKK